MGLLILLTSTLLCSYFHPGTVVDAQRLFTLREITLTIEPSNDVTRGTNVTLRCKASVSSSEPGLRREYTIYKDNNLIYNKTSILEEILYPLGEARVANSGKYRCEINIDNKPQKPSQAMKLTVSGLSKPQLHLNKFEVKEGEEVTATCTAPGETGSFYFYIYEDSNEIKEKQVSSNQAEFKLRFSSVNTRRIHCTYTILIPPDSVKSEESNNVNVSVEELPITIHLDINPENDVYEGDQLNILCKVINSEHSHESVRLLLIQGTQILRSGVTNVSHSMVAQANDPEEFECKLEMGNVVKTATKRISVIELFSVPTLTMSPAEVFQEEDMTLTCKTEHYASERIRKDELIYTLDPPQTRDRKGVFSRKSLSFESIYTCVAEARGIRKRSKTLTVRPKVLVSRPKISVVGRAVLGQPVKILCQSDSGSLPINYTLFKGPSEVRTISIKLRFQQALFEVNITEPEDIKKYICNASNSHRHNHNHSEELNATLIVPPSHAVLMVVPDFREIYEGQHLYLLCRVDGTPPVTFKWYHVGNNLPLYTNTSNEDNSRYEVPSVSKEHSGRYYCEAFNHANKVVRSEQVTITVQMVLWKKALIGGFCLLAVSVLVVVCVLCFRSKRGKRDGAAELSVKPSSPKSDDSLTVTLTHDTEVYNADKVIMDSGAAVSVWTKRPPEEDVAIDEESSMVTKEPDVEYTEVVHPRPVDPARGAADYHDYHGSVEYAELNGEQPEISHYHPEVNNFQDLPMPVD
ncbi:platelet endothelial cell adhesion molecule isoform X2 [Acanthopagrus latus]|uniref:platelet endothelial cell adhesion molecule isoform X2 n=1 Tax=Acanthopagrus latus TaxID=8177 RepID=UPI00187C708F|nr:platelet endothelial cell adhesion molecule isoform X2 [Acanthopagrus latus]